MGKIATALFLVMTTVLANAADIDVLVNKLTEKGIITQSEAKQIISETDKKNKPLPAWLQNMKFGGDFRLRIQSDDPYSAAGTRIRERIRVRAGVETAVSEHFNAAFGITNGGETGAGDKNPTSANHTFQAFNKAPVFLDYGYISYAPSDLVTVSAGKVKGIMALWKVTDLIWDYSINPDGAAANFKTDLSSDASFFANAGYYILNQQTSDAVGFPAVYIVQPGAQYSKKDFSVKAVASYQYFSTKGKTVGSNDSGNWFDPAGGGPIQTDYELWNSGLEVKQKNVISGYAVYAFGEYSRNLYDKVFDSGLNAWVLGAGIGDDKLDKLGTWNLKTMYRRLEPNAAPLGLGEPNAYLGKPGKGFMTVLALGIVKNMDLTTNWYSMTNIDGQNRINTLQFNLNYKF